MKIKKYCQIKKKISCILKDFPNYLIIIDVSWKWHNLKRFLLLPVVFSILMCLWFARDLGDHCEQNRSQASLPQVYAPSDIRLFELQPQTLPLYVGLSALSDAWKIGFKRSSGTEWSFPSNSTLTHCLKTSERTPQTSSAVLVQALFQRLFAFSAAEILIPPK